MLRGWAKTSNEPMMLRSPYTFKDLADFNPESGEVSFFTCDYPVVKQSGWFERLACHFLAVFKYRGQLFLRIDQDTIRLNEVERSEFRRGNGYHYLTVFGAQNRTFRIEYKKPVIDPSWENGIHAFVEEDDFDFGLFLHNLISNPGAAKVMLEALHGC